MKNIKNSLADAYREAVKDENAIDEAMRAVVKASNKLGELVQRTDTSPEMHRHLTELHRNVSVWAAASARLWTEARQTSETLAAAAVNAAEAPVLESDGTCYDGSWEYDADFEPSLYDVEAAE